MRCGAEPDRNFAHAVEFIREAAKEGLARGTEPADFYEGKLCAAEYWIHTELPRVGYLSALCRSGEGSYARMKPGWF